MLNATIYIDNSMDCVERSVFPIRYIYIFNNNNYMICEQE